MRTFRESPQFDGVASFLSLSFGDERCRCAAVDAVTAALEAELRELRRVLPNGDVLKNEYVALRLTAQELADFIYDIRRKCDDSGLWTASISGERGAYPNMLRRGAEHAVAELSRGERKNNAVMYTCSHIVLIASGHLPRAVGLQASHLCHNTKCLKLEHLVWEYRYDNLRRNRCIGRLRCTCALQPPCVPPQAHVVDESAGDE